MRVLFLEAYHGGSHAQFAEMLTAHSRHDVTLLTLPARKWKWRMRGSALWFVEELARRQERRPDAIVTTDMTAVADLRALLPERLRAVPIGCYFHENQLTYPLSNADRRDYQFGFTNITSCLAADQAWFNSQYHRTAFLAAAGRLLEQMPDFLPRRAPNELERKSSVLHPPVKTPPGDTEPVGRRAGPLTILWNHRWEYDKNPEAFFDPFFRLAAEGRPFRLVVLGESFREAPAVFAEAKTRLGDRVAHFGFEPDRHRYWRLLARCHVVLSTSRQENFGLAVVEAMLAGCLPLLPNRLSYPELIPTKLRRTFLYDTDDDLEHRLAAWIGGAVPADLVPQTVSAAERFAAPRQVQRIDDAIEAMAQSR